VVSQAGSFPHSDTYLQEVVLVNATSKGKLTFPLCGCKTVTVMIVQQVLLSKSSHSMPLISMKTPERVKLKVPSLPVL
jgi:hypothetical protein